ncbi:hypothetical protein [Salinibacterium sp. ZJ77]|uniref:hypothetical protein n=1 Tax=Salinibacterium sp. ZJ77 TaxID=2708337 RepID=UPI001424115C|nr:hypothetical protein [Salinibacterium sp. ZJ77]
METLEPELIHIRDAVARGADPRAFRAAAAAGHYVRVRRGVYASSRQWADADDRGRHIARIRAVQAQLRTDSGMAAGYSAAAVHGIAVLRRFPDEVTLLTPYRGGGTAEPGVVRTSARWCADHATQIGGLRVTRLERTVLDVVLRDGFEAGVATIDGVLRDGRVSRSSLDDFLAEWRPRSGADRIRAALDAADPASESFGESMARAVIRRLGFEAPELQARFVDDQGEIRTDFFWRGVSVVAEFDGKVKYTRPELTGGDPASVVWREKLREDRLRRQVRTVVRFSWDDVRDPRRVARLLDTAGVSRSGHRSVRPDARARVSMTA